MATDRPADNPASHGRVEALSDTVSGFKQTDSLVELVKKAAEAALDAEHSAGPDTVIVLLSDDRRLHDLNLEFNGEDSVTDVLSFNDVEGWHNGVPPDRIADEEAFLPPGEKHRLGEIVISLQQTARQASERSIPFEQELAMLTIHGLLHLLGYDHADPEEERVMFGRTDAILETLLTRGEKP